MSCLMQVAKVCGNHQILATSLPDLTDQDHSQGQVRNVYSLNVSKQAHSPGPQNSEGQR